MATFIWHAIGVLVFIAILVSLTKFLFYNVYLNSLYFKSSCCPAQILSTVRLCYIFLGHP